MKTAAVIVIVLALIGVFGKEKKKEPPPSVDRTPVIQKYDCGEPAEEKVSENTKQRIKLFAKATFKSYPQSDEVLDNVVHYIIVFANSYCIEPELAAALIARESGFNPYAVSPSGAKGLGQLIDSTAQRMGVSDPFDIQQNLKGSLGYFKTLLDQWQGHPNQTEVALASYLQGPRVVGPNGDIPESGRRYIDDILAYRQKMLSM